MIETTWVKVPPRKGLVSYPEVVDAYRTRVDSGPTIKGAPIADQSLDWLEQNPFSSVTELAEGREISMNQAVAQLGRLLRRKKVIRHDRPPDRSGCKSKYFYTVSPRNPPNNQGINYGPAKDKPPNDQVFPTPTQ